MNDLTKNLTELALLPSQSILMQPDATAVISLPGAQRLRAQIGTDSARSDVQVRAITRSELQNLPAGDPLPLIIMQAGGPEAAARCLDNANVAAVSSDWAGDPEQARAFYMYLFRFELAHIGINSRSDQEALPLAERFSALFGMEQAANPQSVFCGGSIEVMRTPGFGTHGHLAIRTSHLERAVAYFQRQGLELDTAHPMRRPDGLVMGVYFRQSFGGFALHLMRRV